MSVHLGALIFGLVLFAVALQTGVHLVGRERLRQIEAREREAS